MNLVQVVDVLQGIFTILAIIVAGLWGYFHFFRGRTYKPRLEPDVSGKIMSDGAANYLIATVQLKNVGLSKVEIEQEGSGLRILSCHEQTNMQHVNHAEWNHLATFPVFEDHRWIESGETIKDQLLLTTPASRQVAFQLDLYLVSKRNAWSAAAIIEALVGEETSQYCEQEN